MNQPKQTYAEWKAELSAAVERLQVEEVLWAQITDDEMKPAFERGENPNYFLGYMVAKLSRPGA
jgi:hypothetical protein